MSVSFKRNILPQNATLKEALLAMNEGLHNVALFVDENERMVGMMTDGDFRRAFLSGADMKSTASQYMNHNFISGSTHQSRETQILTLNRGVQFLPILDDSQRLTDLLSLADRNRLPIMTPQLNGNELKYVTDCVQSGWISSQGNFVKLFEDHFANFVKIKHALTTSSGTTALHLALCSLHISEGDEVIVPNLTFAATASAVRHAGATPVFVDVDRDHWTIDVHQIEKAITPRTKAIIPVHVYGHPCDMDPLMEIAHRHNLYVVEDCAESLGATYKGKHTGTIGDIGCFSFFSNKVITTGEGGMVITNSEALRDGMQQRRDHGMSRTQRYYHEVLGYNYRMTNVQAAIGVAQLEQIDTFLTNRRNIADRYRERLQKLQGIRLPIEMPWAKNIYWLYSIIIDSNALKISRDQIIRELARDGIETRPLFLPLHNQPPFRNQKSNPQRSDFPITQNLADNGLSLPSSNGLTDDEILRTCDVLKRILSISVQ